MMVELLDNWKVVLMVEHLVALMVDLLVVQ